MTDNQAEGTYERSQSTSPEPEKSTARTLGAALLILLPLIVVAGLRAWPAWDPYLAAPWFHFQVVSFTSLVAFVLALLVGNLTEAVADVRTLFVTSALAAIAGIFMIHGLATPGVLFMSSNLAVFWSGPISVAVGAVFLAAAGITWPPAVAHWITTHRAQLAWLSTLLYGVYVVMALWVPAPLAALSRLRPATTYVLGGITCLLYVAAGLRFWRTYRRRGRRFDAVLAIAAGLLADTVVIMVTMPLWNLSWWLYHVLMLAAFSITLGAVILEYERARHFRLIQYFAATGVVAVALLTLVAGELATRMLGTITTPDGMRLLRWGTSGLFVAMSAALFAILLRIVQRGDELLSERAEAIQVQRVALERARMAQALVSIGLAIGSTLELDRVLDIICQESLKLFDVHAAFLWLREGDELVGRAGRGHNAEQFLGLRRRVSSPNLLGSRIVRESEPIFVNHAYRGADVDGELLARFDVRAILGVPLLEDDEARGALMLIDTQNDAPFTALDLEVATIFGQQAAMALTHAHLYERVQQQTQKLSATLEELRGSYEATLAALSAALDARDHETEGHSRRVTAYALMLAEALGVDDEATREAIEWGALLHDVGKIGVPDAILHKPSGLTEVEWTVMRRHPEIGYRILRDIPFLERTQPIVLHHHERWDGTGYPTGLRGENIPLPARIFAVADALDAMTSSRPYRPALSFVEARAEILHHRGTQFDPAVVDAFESIPEAAWRTRAKEVTGP